MLRRYGLGSLVALAGRYPGYPQRGTPTTRLKVAEKWVMFRQLTSSATSYTLTYTSRSNYLTMRIQQRVR